MAKTDKKREVHVYADWHGLNGPEYIRRQRDLRQKDERRERDFSGVEISVL
jgi:hypothetical protein